MSNKTALRSKCRLLLLGLRNNPGSETCGTAHPHLTAPPHKPFMSKPILEFWGLASSTTTQHTRLLGNSVDVYQLCLIADDVMRIR